MTRTQKMRPFHQVSNALIAGCLLALPAQAQWVQTHEQFYLEAPHNWQFRDRYMAADRLFNAFDFGHAILYETLWNKPGAPVSELEEKWYDRLTKKILVKPPRVPLEEGAIEIAYVQLAPEAKMMFEWAHVLHRQIYDVLADERLTQAQKDAEVARVVGYYKTRPDVAFSSQPKSMALMQEQPYSLAFRKDYPKFNGLIWAYHWLQIGLYEPLIKGQTVEERQSLVRATVSRFWQMLKDPPQKMPHQMPMTAAVAPAFTERYPEAAIIFDNLHSMHDVISDILANPSVPRDRKRAEILVAARRFRDDTSYVVSRESWRMMAQHMGIENMGGPAVGFLPELPTPTVTYGAVMAHDERTGAMTGFKYGAAVGGEHAGHAMADTTRRPATDPHAGHAMPDTAKRPARDTAHAGHAMADTTGRPMTMAALDSGMMDLHVRMLGDPVIRDRIKADSAMLRMMKESISQMPPEHREHLESMLRETTSGGNVERAPTTRARTPTAPRPGATKASEPKPTATKSKAPARTTTNAAPTKTKTAPTKTNVPATKQPADPHAGHKVPPPAKKPPAAL
jgi:cell division septation protein DedD